MPDPNAPMKFLRCSDRSFAGHFEKLGHHACSRLWLAITDRDKFDIERLHPINPTHTLGSIFLRPSQQSRQASQQCDASNAACTCAKVITSAYFACKSKRLALCGAE